MTGFTPEGFGRDPCVYGGCEQSGHPAHVGYKKSRGFHAGNNGSRGGSHPRYCLPFGIVTEQFQALGEGLNVGFRAFQTEIEQGAR